MQSSSQRRTDGRFRPEFRLRNARDFRRVFRRRCSVADENFVVYIDYNELPFARLGMSVSRKVGPAVHRNRWKRCVREVFRQRLRTSCAGFDLIIVARQGDLPSYERMQQVLPALAQRAQRRLKHRRPDRSTS